MSIIKKTIHTNNAPAAIGIYSQAIATTGGQTVYLSGQIPLVPETMAMISDEIEPQIHQVFKNIRAVCQASGAQLSDIVKLNIFLTDLSHFGVVNEVMAQYFQAPFPARAAIGVKQLPRDALVEMDGILCF